MALLYSVIARRNIVLARHADCLGNFGDVTDQLLSKIDISENAKMTYSQGSYLYHYISSKGLIYLCIADEGMRRSVAFSFLDKIKRKFEMQFGSQLNSAIPFAMNTEFSPVLAAEMKRANSLAARGGLLEVDPEEGPSTSRRQQLPENLDKVERVRDEVERVKDIMVSNIDAILVRGERLDLLVDKTENLSNRANTFKQASRTLARRMWWQNTKIAIGIAIAVVVILYVVVSASCGGMSWPNCVHSRTNGTN